jgi:dipeptidyl aminopeptidase/acylaminoacyl peptidase
LRDGRGLLYVSSGGGGRDIYEQRIRSNGLADGPPRRVTTGLDAHTIALSRDGRRLAYSKYTRDVNIWTLRVPPGGRASVRTAVEVTRGNQAIESVKLSPDGKWLAYESDLNGNADIFVVSAQGGTARQLTDDPADDMAPDWSPDGSQLAFHSMRTGRRNIFTMNADGTGLTAAHSSSVTERFAVWATNNSLAYLRDTGDFAALEEVTRVSRAAPWGQPRMLAPQVQRLLTGSTPDHSAYIAEDVKGFPLRVPSGGGPSTPLLRPQVLPNALYSRLPGDGRTLYYFNSDSAGFYIGAADLAHATTRKVITFDEPGREATRGEFDTDGTRFFFTIAHHQTDIWVADVERR